MSGILSISHTTIYKIEHNISQAKYKTLETILNSLDLSKRLPNLNYLPLE